MKEKRNIILIGMPGSGKSTVGALLAKRLGMEFADGDTLICRRQGAPLQQVLDACGLEEFLRVEEQTMLETDFSDTVLATGGSVPLREGAMKHLQKNGCFVFLDVPLEELQRRINNLSTRGIAFAPGQTLADIYHQRLPIYRRWADITITVEHPDGDSGQMVEEIVRHLNER